MIKLLFLVVVVVVVGNEKVMGADIPLLSDLLSIFDQKETANIFITLSEGPEGIIDGLIQKTFGSRADKIETLTNDLMDHANRTQTVVINLLNDFIASTGQNMTIKSFWISNQIYVKGANKVLVLLLQTLGSIIGFIKEEAYAGFEPIKPEVATYNESEYTWGFQKIDVPGAWALQKTLKTTLYPVVVGSIDSGVRYTHAELSESYVGGEYGWYDPVEQTPMPNDNIGHGTHTMGTIVGKNVGVAPLAKWLSCKGCQGEECAQSDLLSCGQFLMCPTKADGTSPDCSKAPHIINNSWGNNKGSDPTYQKMIAAWRSVGIIPIFSVGNSGPYCGTARSPGDYDSVISVGSSNANNDLSRYSSKGPAGGFLGIGGKQKPDLSAPGENVLSAWHTGDNDYRKISGTSMAAPHVTGVVALMFEAKGNMTFDAVKSALLGGTTQDGRRPSTVCETQLFTYKYPNNEFGQGILNAKNSLQKALG